MKTNLFSFPQHIAALISATLLLFLAAGTSSFGKTTTKTYAAAIYQGQECSVQVNWHNWSGFGPVDGHINLPDGTTIPFSGSNPRKGVLEIEANGESLTLVKEGDGNTASWISGKLAFSEGAGAVSPAAGSKTPVDDSVGASRSTAESFGVVPKRGIVEKSYTGTWRGKDCTARITWTPADDPDTLRTGAGQLVVEGDMVHSITGWQPRENYIEFGIEPDPTKEVYKATQETQSGRTSWVGRFLSLDETNGADAGTRPGPPPRTTTQPPPPRGSSSRPAAEGKAVWVIACQASSSRQEAEKYADAWVKRGFTSGSLWMPDYSSLSGAKMYLTYVGWYDYSSEKDQAMADLGRVKGYYPEAYGIKLDQSGRREQF